MEKLKSEIDTTHCYMCGAPKKEHNNSFHCWDIVYECGCQIGGALTDNNILLFEPCPSENKIK